LLQAIQKDSAADTDKEKEAAKVQLVRTLRHVDLNERPLAIEESGTSLISMKKTLGHDEVQAIITVLLVNLNDYFNVTKGLNTYQFIEVSEIIISEYGHIRIEELVFIFQKAKIEAELFGTLDGSKIFKWIKEYEAAKEESRHNRHLRQKNNDFDVYLSTDNSTRYRILSENLQQRYESKNLSMQTGEVIHPEKKKQKRKAKTTKKKKAKQS